MANKVVLFSLKGGQGKTTLAVHHAAKVGGHYVTIDHVSGTRDLYESFFEEGRFTILKEGEGQLETTSKRVVFDFGISQDKRQAPIIKMADLVVVPFCYQGGPAEKALKKGIDVLDLLTSKIAIVLNNTLKAETPEALGIIHEEFGDKYPVWEVPFSKFFWRIEQKRSLIWDMHFQGALNGRLKELQQRLTQFSDNITNY